MRYQTATDFRTALEQRLTTRARDAEVSVDRLRRLAVFERILARLTDADPGMWILKGGAALEMRWPANARTTKDLDLATRLQPVSDSHLHEHLIDVLAMDTDNDAFQFVVAPPRPLRTDEAGRPGWRFSVLARLAGREFATITLDVVQRDRGDRCDGAGANTKFVRIRRDPEPCHGDRQHAPTLCGKAPCADP